MNTHVLEGKHVHAIIRVVQQQIWQIAAQLPAENLKKSVFFLSDSSGRELLIDKSPSDNVDVGVSLTRISHKREIATLHPTSSQHRFANKDTGRLFDSITVALVLYILRRPVLYQPDGDNGHGIDDSFIVCPVVQSRRVHMNGISTVCLHVLDNTLSPS